MEGDVTVAVSHSSINYKDGLALTGSSPVVRRWPMIPGIDFAGTVRESTHPDHAAGDAVVLNGWGLGETHLGGYGELARVSGDWLVPLPAALTRRSGHGHRHRRLHGDALRDGAGAPRHRRRRRTDPRHGRGRGRGQRGGRPAVEARPRGDRLHGPCRGRGRLPPGSRRIGDPRPQRAVRARPTHGQGALGRRPSTASAATRWPTCSPRPATAARSPPAAWPRAWTCPARSRRSSSAASPSPASTASWRRRPCASRRGAASPPTSTSACSSRSPSPDRWPMRPQLASEILAGQVRGRVVLDGLIPMATDLYVGGRWRPSSAPPDRGPVAARRCAGR